MKISKKLALQKKLGGVVLFREGLFLRAYNQSAFILTQLHGHHLKISCQRLKTYDNAWIVSCAFPANKLSERLPKAVVTNFGAQLVGIFDMTNYEHWLERRCSEESIAKKAAKAEVHPLQTDCASVSSRLFD